MLKTYEYRLYPNKEQVISITRHFGCTRFVYNKALALKMEIYAKYKKDISKWNVFQIIYWYIIRNSYDIY